MAKVIREGSRVKRVVLCGVSGCCPTIDFTSDGVLMADDRDGSVFLSREQWRELMELAKSESLGGTNE